MLIDNFDRRKKVTIFFSIVFLLLIFSASIYDFIQVKDRVWRGRVFDVWYSNGKTRIVGFNRNRISFNNEYDFKINKIYEIKYYTRFGERKLISYEIIDTIN